MDRFSASQLDLSRLPAPTMIEQINFETILAASKATFLEVWEALRQKIPTLPEYDTLDLESDTAHALLQAFSYREMVLRADFNDRLKATLVAYAVGADLDQRAVSFGLERRVITPASGNTPAVMEGDAEFRRRVQMAPEAFSTAGSEGAYFTHAMIAAPELCDVAVTMENPGPYARAVVACLSRNGNGTPSEASLNAVRDRLRRRDIMPASVPFIVTAPGVVNYEVEAVLHVRTGADSATVRAKALSAVQKMRDDRRWLGFDILRQAFEAAARVPGVEKVELLKPAQDQLLTRSQVGHCTAITLTTEVTDG